MAFIKTQHAAGKHYEWNVTDRPRPANQRRLALAYHFPRFFNHRIAGVVVR